MSRRDGWHSPLDTADAAFTALVTGPAPLSLHGAAISRELPQRPIPVDELKRRLLDRSTSGDARDAAWAELVRRARTGGPSWMVAAVGVAMPGLRRVAGRLAHRYDGDTADLDAEVLTGFLAAVKTVDTTRPSVALRLCWAAFRAGAKARYADGVPAETRRVDADDGAAPPRPFGHPDLVLARAVAVGVVTAAEADLVGRTRLEHVSLRAMARELGIAYEAVKKRRQRVERRLVQAITSGDLDQSLSPNRR